MYDPGPKAVAGRRAIDLNADLGEGFPNDLALLDRVSSANVCCGAHGGGPDAIRRTLQAAAVRGVVVGAHPGFPDREGFGRREQDLSTDEVVALILDQTADLARIHTEPPAPIRFLKPHGALYNQAQRQEAVARGVVEAARRLGLPVVGQPGSLLELLARGAGARFIAEGFPDRHYRPDGSLTPRDQAGAILTSPEDLAANVRALLADPRVATLCIHGDELNAAAVADLVRSMVEGRGIAVRSFLE